MAYNQTPTLETCIQAGKINPLVRGGTSQLDRYLNQLKPGYISVNEKTQAQWLAFTANMARCLNYYNAQNNLAGNWSAFFNNNLINYARVSLEDVPTIQTYFNNLISIMQSQEGDYNPQQRCDAFGTICYSIFTICGFINSQLLAAPAGSDYNNRLTDLISTQLKQPLTRLMGYSKGAGQNFMTGGLSTVFPPIPLFGFQVSSDPAVFNANVSSPLWFSPYADENDLMNSLTPDTGIFATTPGYLPSSYSDPQYELKVWRCFLKASRQTLFTSIINTFINACTYIQQYNAQAFSNTLSTGQLPPHLCLYFTFLTMLEQPQSDLNQFTERHLNFFYESVLRLGPLPAQPNQAHVTVQIAKDVAEYMLPAGTLFNAGKDDTGVNVSYSLLRDTVFNQATVAQLKSFYIAGQSVPQGMLVLAGETDNNTSANIINSGKAFASSVANSIDGIGGAITADPPAWQAFGNKTVSNTGDVTMLMPLANVGFAIASQYLYLQEGTRTIEITLNTRVNPQCPFTFSPFKNPQTNLPPGFTCSLTTPGTKTGWTTTTPLVTVNSGSVVFTINLPPSFPAVGGYSTKLNGLDMQTDLPLIQFTLIDDDFGHTGNFFNLQFMQFTTCTINVTVGTLFAACGRPNAGDFDGIKTLFLSNDTGPVDATQPFSPFGSPAYDGGSLVVGCKELFMKPGASYSLLVEHTGLPDYSKPPQNNKPNSEHPGNPTNGVVPNTYLAFPAWVQGSLLFFVDISSLDPYDFVNVDQYPQLQISSDVAYCSNPNPTSIFTNVAPGFNSNQNLFNNGFSNNSGINSNFNFGNVQVFNLGGGFTGPVGPTPQTVSNLAFNVPQISLGNLQNGHWTDGNSSYYPFMTFATSDSPIVVLATGSVGNISDPPPIAYEEGYKPYSQASTDGFFRINLTADFGYNKYIQALIQYRLEQTPDPITSTYPKPGYEPVQPYSPLIKSLSLNYTASVTLDLTANEPGNKYVNYYYVYPFGAAQLTYPVPVGLALTDGENMELANVSQYQPLTTTQGATVQVPVGNITWFSANGLPLPPGYANVFPAYYITSPATGTLLPVISEFYIGLSNLIPGQNINLLFQVLDGSTNPLVAKPKPQIYWSYLTNNQWIAFQNIIDATADLIQSGILTLQIPFGATSQNTLLPGGYIWIKGAITEYPEAICELIGVLPQAALVQFTDKGNSPDFLQNQIPSGTITKLVKPLGAIKKILQPFQSFGGSVAESMQAFWVRVSERLRHKDRAIQIWDYEHQILRQFPTIQKVKCLNHTAYNPGANNSSVYDVLYSEQAPGNVTIVTVPYINVTNSANALTPYTDVATLNAIGNFISARISAQVTLHVQNPIFEEIRMALQVSFTEGLDKTYYTGVLNQAIIQFLSPWAFTTEADISFGGIIYKSTIINFIENQSYVNYIINVTMCSRPSDSNLYSPDQDAIEASNGISILVSAPEHNVIPI